MRTSNPIRTGAVSLTLIVLLLLAAFYSDDLPIVGGGTSYAADFSEAAGLVPGNEVRVAGVKVGKVTKVKLNGDKVRVTFKVKDAWVGDRTTAMIRIKTLLGQKFLSLDPQGTQPLSPGDPIPKERTLAPYDVNEAFNGLATTVGQIDTKQLADSFTVLSDTFKNSPEHVRGALDGLSALSKTISSRDEQLAKLLDNTRQLTRTLADRNAEFEKLLADGNLLLGELRKRREAISALLTGTRNLSRELSGLVTDNQNQLGPALEQLGRVTTILQRNQDNLDRSLALMAPFYRVFANTLGNGRWFDTYICGLLPPSVNLGVVGFNEEGCLPPGVQR
ncbi:phospholipid/cholesterol/gamma-HCH transport system substrate-binding protein [Lentzea albidocapillata subsp. violacea]|uniref:Phospholipid/cholesterol/gamma-HCH transport system substrate-binding protein n=1 Tax=Lentzea albidocapillata subsp. violacea TaxID=128104 RepID=A0A1G9UXC3_9PSEU|nr:MCE family protein [Lentzea albidocapillata]SDM64469.1 phospholipid/cholesterol/gamma-HCH transport system substrate-binding protein [Lentzea albidocapillata subsp. violacea]